MDAIATDPAARDAWLPAALSRDLAEELHLPSDRLAIAYRQYIRKLGLTFGTA